MLQKHINAPHVPAILHAYIFNTHQKQIKQITHEPHENILQHVKIQFQLVYLFRQLFVGLQQKGTKLPLMLPCVSYNRWTVRNVKN